MHSGSRVVAAAVAMLALVSASPAATPPHHVPTRLWYRVSLDYKGELHTTGNWSNGPNGRETLTDEEHTRWKVVTDGAVLVRREAGLLAVQHGNYVETLLASDSESVVTGNFTVLELEATGETTEKAITCSSTATNRLASGTPFAWHGFSLQASEYPGFFFAPEGASPTAVYLELQDGSPVATGQPRKPGCRGYTHTSTAPATFRPAFAQPNLETVQACCLDLTARGRFGAPSFTIRQRRSATYSWKVTAPFDNNPDGPEAPPYEATTGKASQTAKTEISIHFERCPGTAPC